MAKKQRAAKLFYHVTKQGNIDGILREGLIPGRGVPLLGEVEFPDVVWLDSSIDNLVHWTSSGRFDGHVILKVDSYYFDNSQLIESGWRIMGRSTWWKYRGRILPVAIELLLSIDNSRTSVLE